MPVCYEHKFIFVHIPKCAGTSVRKALKSAGVRLDFEGPVRPEHQVRYAIDEKWLHHLPAPALKRILPENVWEEFFKFTFVRNPWDRLVSKYHFNKQVHATNPMFRIRRPEWSRALDNSGSFDEWIRRGIEYVRPVMGFIADENGKLLVDFVGRHENLEQDFRYVCDRIGIHAELPHEMKSGHAGYRVMPVTGIITAKKPRKSFNGASPKRLNCLGMNSDRSPASQAVCSLNWCCGTLPRRGFRHAFST